MGTPNQYEKKPPKRNVTVKIDQDLLDKAREKKINISKVCRHALRATIEGKLENGVARSS